MDTGYTLRLTRDIAAPVERVWDSLVRANDLDRWLTSGMVNDPRVGGKYRDANGDKGEYLLIQPPHRLRFSWENEGHCPNTVVEVYLESVDAGESRLGLDHRGLASKSDVEHMRQGWEEALDNLRRYLENEG